MDPFRKYIITQIIKQSGKIPRADSILNQVRGLKRTLEKMGVDISKVTDPKEITKYFNMEKSWFNQILKQKAKNIGLMDPNKNIFMKKGPFEGFKPKVVPKPKDIKSKLDKQNKESIQRWKDKMKDPEDLAEGGIAGMLGERTGFFKGSIDEWREQNPSREELLAEFPPEKSNVKLPGLKVYPFLAGSQKSEDIEGMPLEIDAQKRTIVGGGTLMGEGENYYGGIEGLKVKEKIDFILDNQTLFKDTTDDDKISFILGKKSDDHDLRLKIDKELENARLSYQGKYGNIGLQTDTGFEDPNLTWSKTWKFAGGGLAPMLGEPTYQDDNHRVPLKWGKRPISAGMQVLDEDWDDMNPDEWENILKSVGAYQDGGRVPLKKGKTPFKPPLPGENWIESWWKNLGPWEKMSVFGFGLKKGGRVGLQGGGIPGALLFAIKELMKKYGPNIIKLAKDVKPSKKWDTQKAVQGFLERNPQFKNKITAHSGDVVKAGEGRFSKAEVLLEMFKNTIKKSKSANTIKRFTNFSKEIQNKPELAKESKVWNFFTKGLPKDQKLTVYGDDTVDFWRQSKFGPHNIKTTDKFMKKHPYLTRDQAVKIQNMEPENQIFELKKIQALRKRTTNAEGGIIGLNAGGPLNTQALIQLYMSEGMTEEEATAAAGASANLPWNILTDKAEGGRVGMIWGGGVWKTIIQNLARAKGVTPSDYLKVTNWKTLPKEVRNLMSKVDFEKMKQGRIEMFENWVEMAKTRMNFLKNIKEGKKTPAAPIFEHLEKSFKSPVPGKVSQKDILQGEYILKNLKTKGRKLHASGGVAGMLGE